MIRLKSSSSAPVTPASTPSTSESSFSVAGTKYVVLFAVFNFAKHLGHQTQLMCFQHRGLYYLYVFFSHNHNAGVSSK